jgi:hypothetical protein
MRSVKSVGNRVYLEPEEDLEDGVDIDNDEWEDEWDDMHEEVQREVQKAKAIKRLKTAREV